MNQLEYVDWANQTKTIILWYCTIEQQSDEKENASINAYKN